jgi:hypothetical protein
MEETSMCAIARLCTVMQAKWEVACTTIQVAIPMFSTRCFLPNQPDDLGWDLSGYQILTKCALELANSYTTLTNCKIFGQGGEPSDPSFIDNGSGPLDNDYRLVCGSNCIDAGDNTYLEDDDAFDVDEDGFDGEEGEIPTLEDVIPPADYDLEFTDRIIGTGKIVDIGAFERTIQSPCTSLIDGDTAPLPCTNGLVNVDDLLQVINNWGNCDDWLSFCAGDISANSGVVDTDDLLEVVMNWSDHCVLEEYSAGSLSSVEDCMDAASLEYTPYSTEWDEAVEKCVNALCAAEVIDCED